MPNIIGTWAAWGVFISFLAAVAAIALLFRPSIRGYSNGLLVYRVISVVALVLSIPGVLFSPSLGLGLSQLGGNAVNPLVWVSLLAGVAAFGVIALTLLGIGLPEPSVARSTLSAITPTNGPPPPVGFTYAPPQASVPPSLAEEAVPSILHPPSLSTSDRSLADSLPTQLDALSPLEKIKNLDYEPNASETILIGPQRDYFAWLIELTGQRAGTAHRLLHRRIVIGRGASAGIKLNDPAISTEHAVLLLPEESTEYILHDLASSNGTFIRGQRVGTPHRLQDGDRIELGESRLFFMEMRLNGESHHPKSGEGQKLAGSTITVSSPDDTESRADKGEPPTQVV